MRKKGAYFRLSLLLYFLPLFFTMKHVDLCRGLVSTLFQMQWYSYMPPTLMLKKSAEEMFFYTFVFASRNGMLDLDTSNVLGQKIKEKTCYAQ